MNEEEKMFFAGRAEAFMLYESFRKRLMHDVPEARVKVSKTQISFFLSRMFACVSFRPVKRKAERGDVFITVTFSLPYMNGNERCVCSNPCPGRFTHHVLVRKLCDIDDELMVWINEAADAAS